MNETERYLKALFEKQGIAINSHTQPLFQAFANEAANINHVKEIRQLQQRMTKDFKLIARRAEIDALPMAFPNGIVGKPYHAEFNLNALGLNDITAYTLKGFENSGLVYDMATKTISGIPQSHGDIQLVFAYHLADEEENTLANEKKINLIINPDPKSLWKNIPSNADDIYAKADEVAETTTFLTHTLKAVSKRGRSHANKGSFRDDDYAYAELANGWGLMAISDGAGSASYSRKGSLLACQAVVQYFETHFSPQNIAGLEEAINVYATDPSVKAKLLDIAAPYLSAAAKNAQDTIANFASTAKASLNDFHATLAFVLIKQFPTGYAFLSFAVGDCPVVLVDKALAWVKPLNKLDVGEYGGGTRFITMPEIFAKADFEERFNFEFTPSLPYVFLMTDGIYDPKFEVEANLAKPEKWKAFLEDLKGANEEGINALSEAETSKNLAHWTNFWSPGNHDDRTLLILA